MNIQNLILGVIFLLLGCIAIYFIQLFNSKGQKKTKNKSDQNDFRLYLGVIGGVIIGLYLIVKELINLFNTL